MLIVLLFLLVATSAATMATYTTTYEVRSTLHLKRSMQARYAGESGLSSAIGWVDVIKPGVFVQAIERSDKPQMSYFGEPELLGGGYRFDLEFINDYVTGTTSSDDVSPLLLQGEDDSPSFGPGRAYEPWFAVDVYDYHIDSAPVRGSKVGGGGKSGRMAYFRATYAGRGRGVVQGDVLDTYDISGVAHFRGVNQASKDVRGQATSGPFFAGNN